MPTLVASAEKTPVTEPTAPFCTFTDQPGAALEVTFYDSEFDEEDEAQGRESRDDFLMLFVGPTPAAIMQVQRDLLVQDLVNF